MTPEAKVIRAKVYYLPDLDWKKLTKHKGMFTKKKTNYVELKKAKWHFSIPLIFWLEHQGKKKITFYFYFSLLKQNKWSHSGMENIPQTNRNKLNAFVYLASESVVLINLETIVFHLPQTRHATQFRKPCGNAYLDFIDRRKEGIHQIYQFWRR